MKKKFDLFVLIMIIAIIAITIFFVPALFYFAVDLRYKTEIIDIISNNVGIVLLVLAVLAITVVMSVIITNVFAVKLLKPISSMADFVGRPDSGGERAKSIPISEYPPPYPELEPFMEMLQSQHDDILRSVNVRQEFTANVTHELKTPLTAISGYSELIENGMLDQDETIRVSREIRQNANRLLTLINDIIRLSELDTMSEQEVTYERIDLFELTEKCVESLKVYAENNEITIASEGETCEINVNREMIEELIINLCDNAIRYNKRGGHVWIKVFSEKGHAVLSVKDDGIGIPDQHQKRVFERFYCVDKSRSKRLGGTGLGLAIVKHIAAIHDAELSLESKADEGTEIRVIF